MPTLQLAQNSKDSLAARIYAVFYIMLEVAKEKLQSRREVSKG